jgi:hypothetical protein
MMQIQPWKLRLEHFGFSHVRMEWAGRTIHFNPISKVHPGDIAVVLWNWPEQLQGVIQSLKEGTNFTVVAPPEILDWLKQFGDPNGSTSYAADGLDINLESYTPIPALTVREGIRKIRSTIRNPARSIQRLRIKDGIPDCEPHIAWVRFPSGILFGHLHLSLHAGTPTEWNEFIRQKVQDATWILIGCDYEEHDVILDRLCSLSPKQVLLTDLIGDYRRKMGLPTKLLTPIADQAIIKNLDVKVFATKVGYRFDTVNLLQ